MTEKVKNKVFENLNDFQIELNNFIVETAMKFNNNCNDTEISDVVTKKIIDVLYTDCINAIDDVKQEYEKALYSDNINDFLKKKDVYRSNMYE